MVTASKGVIWLSHILHNSLIVYQVLQDQSATVFKYNNAPIVTHLQINSK